MDAIRSYIDQMFRSLPRTAEVRRAHDELVQMSEDRYRELRAEGVSDHEAVGRVITQFGNLDELADDLGIRREVDSLGGGPEAVELSDADADAYLANRRTGARFVSAGVLTVLLGLAGFMLLSEGMPGDPLSAGAIGLGVLFLGIVVAVGLFITGGVTMSRFERLDERELRLDPATVARYSAVRDRETPRFIAGLVSGTAAILLGVALVAVVGSLATDDERASGIAVAGLLALVGVGASLIVLVGVRRGAVGRLADPEADAEETRRSSLVGAVAGPYWMLVVVVFLGWSFLGDAWDRSWMVWPIAAVLFGFVAATIASVETYRARR